MVRLSGVDINYGGPPVLDNLTLDLTEPAHHAVMGASGSGKSTILKVILTAFLNRPEPDLPAWQGDIELRAGVTVSYVPQEPSLASWLSVRQNIALGRKLREGARARGVGPLGEKFVHELRLGEWLEYVPSKISIGTARRAALARSLVSKPDLLLLDEPFSGMDFDLRERAIEVLETEFQNSDRQIIMVTHEPYEASLLTDFVHIVSPDEHSKVRTIRRGMHEPLSGFETRIRENLISILDAKAVDETA